MVIDENNIAKPRPVVAGDLVENGVVIKSGLKGKWANCN